MGDHLHNSEWTFLSNHSHVLYCISIWPEIRIREIAQKVNITERAVQRIVVDLEEARYLTRQRVGRQNRYRLRPGLHLRHPLEHHVEVGRLLSVLQPREKAPPRPTGSLAANARRRKAASARSTSKAASPLRRKKPKHRKVFASKSP
jgi:hypothetical protein